MALNIATLRVLDETPLADVDMATWTPPVEPATGGRPPTEPDPISRVVVEVMSTFGASQETICRELVVRGVQCADRETLRHVFAEELAYGKERRMAGYAMKMHSIAMSNSPNAFTACRYLLTLFGGPQWRVPKEEAPGASGATLPAGGVRIVIPDNGRGFPAGAHPGYVTIDGDPVEDERAA